MHSDAEYLSNVLSALSVQAPPGLGTLLALVTVPAVRGERSDAAFLCRV